MAERTIAPALRAGGREASWVQIPAPPRFLIISFVDESNLSVKNIVIRQFFCTLRERADMSWPHDPDGEQGSEGQRKYGMAIIAKKVDEQDDFPLNKDEFLDAHGEDPIRLNHQEVVSVGDIFEYVEEEQFEEITDLHEAVGDAMRRGDFWEYTPENSPNRAEEA